MTASRSAIDAARQAPDRAVRTQQLASLMSELKGAFGQATFAQLCAEGFTAAEILAFSDDARLIAAGRPIPEETFPAGRLEGEFLVGQAKAVRGQASAAEPEPAAVAPASEPIGVLAHLERRFGSLGQAILADMAASGLVVLPEADLAAAQQREADLTNAIEDTVPLVDFYLRRVVGTSAWAKFRGTLVELVEAA